MARRSRHDCAGLVLVLALTACGGGGSSVPPGAVVTLAPAPPGESLNMVLHAQVDLPGLMASGGGITGRRSESAAPLIELGGAASHPPDPRSLRRSEFGSARRPLPVGLSGPPRPPDVAGLHDEKPLAVTGPGGVSASGNWGYTTPDGRRFALTGTSGGLSIVEVTDFRRPRRIAHVPGGASRWREVKTYRQYVYVVTEARTGLDIVDMRNPDRPAKVRTWNETFTSAHTLWIDAERGLLFANGTSNGMRVLDLEPDPENPRDVGGWSAFYVHDSYARGDVLYASAIFEGFLALLDVRDPARIHEITRIPTGGRFTHNSWLTRDGRYAFTTDERANRPLEGWDILDPFAPRKVSEYIARPGGIPHNVMIDGDRLLVAHYTDGVRLLDVSDPEQPRVLGYYDTYPGTAEGFAGAWGAYVFPASDLIVVSDISGGLFVVQYTGG